VRDGPECGGIDNLRVLGFYTASAENAPHRHAQGRRVGLTGAPQKQRPVERARDAERPIPFSRRKIDVPAAQREAVLLAHRRRDLDADRKIQVEHHAPDQRGLLEILLPEHRDIGLKHAEQLRDHGQHPAEVARPGCSTQHAGALLRHHRDVRLATRVHFRGRRRKKQVHSCRFGELGIALQAARVAVQVLRRPELQRVDEDRHRDPVGHLPCPLHQREMAGVEVPHRRDQRDAHILPPGQQHGLPHSRLRLDALHPVLYAKVCSAAGYSPLLTAST